MIELTTWHWEKIKERLVDDYGKGVLLLRDRLKREFGLTVRMHSEYPRKGYTKSVICLDFYDDAKETLFRLKYL